MGLDIRWPIGLMFSLLGVLLSGYGVFNRVAAVTNGNGNGNGNGSGRRGGATEAQQRAIFAICKANGIDMAAALADFNVSDAKDLHVKDASRLIDQLKSGQPAQ